MDMKAQGWVEACSLRAGAQSGLGREACLLRALAAMLQDLLIDSLAIADRRFLQEVIKLDRGGLFGKTGFRPFRSIHLLYIYIYIYIVL